MKEMLNRTLVKSEEMLIPKFSGWAKEQGAEYVLTLGEPDFTTPDDIKAACHRAIDANKTNYSLNLGNLDFRQKICEFEARTNQIEYEPHEVMVTAGSTEGLTAALMTMINPGDEVIVLTPGYPLYPAVIGFTGGTTVALDTSKNKFQVDEAMLERVITPKTKAIIVTSPGNPTGTILNQQSLEAIYKAAKEHRFFILSDECYNQIVFEERQQGITQYQDIRELIVVCQSLSKPYAMAGWRLGYMLAVKGFMEEAMKVHQYLIAAVNTFVQNAGIEALDYDTKDMIEVYRSRRDYLYGRLVGMGFEVEKPQGAFYIFPSIKKFGMGSWEFCQKLVLEESVAFIPGICFEADDFVRISYCVDMDTVVKAMDRLERFIGTL
ncbi:MAG: aminotransferase class I/II-fold pyridoxal phosphate-dependent enzyme [Turicibacter sp.]|nr:aminotransferase class I/II-fold pyridoxal phosphate-dependent enzyme [Turicibacter sp.]